MKAALEQTQLCQGDVPVGAIIVHDDTIIATGYNQREALNDPLGHAELGAIRAASIKLGSWRLGGCAIFCTLEPCPMCAEAIIQSRLQLLVFGAYDPVAGAAGSVFNLFAKRKALPAPDILAGIMEEECVEPLKQFFKEQRQRANKQ